MPAKPKTGVLISIGGYIKKSVGLLHHLIHFPSLRSLGKSSQHL